ncbi:hypothetical protein MBLNU457_4461t1 [Dothideomycetes sp. NU457]
MSSNNYAVLPKVGSLQTLRTQQLPDQEPVVQGGMVGLQPPPAASDFRRALHKGQRVTYWTETDPDAIFAAGVPTRAITEWDSVGQQGKKQPRFILDMRKMTKAAEKTKEAAEAQAIAKAVREEVLALSEAQYYEEGLTKSGWVAINGKLPTPPATDSDISSNGSESEPVNTKTPRELRKIKAGRVKKDTNASQAASSKPTNVSKSSKIVPKSINTKASTTYSIFDELPDTPRTPGTADTVKLALRGAAKAAAARNAIIAAADIAALAARKKQARKAKRTDRDSCHVRCPLS